MAFVRLRFYHPLHKCMFGKGGHSAGVQAHWLLSLLQLNEYIAL